ncbi:3-oxo-tetronate kinase [Actinomadura napierensis]|uniref:3-oxo-tetronate kinase n=1 Tax=Actinomadura napierensis TaxID=267854 RepID=A0ABP5LEJ3_9ACTN
MTAPALGCIADDYTGGTDVAAALRRSGLSTALLFGPPDDESVLPDCDAVVVALKTRTAPRAQAISQHLAVHRWLAGQGVTRFYIKYCSTFDSTARGNIGPTVDAVMEAADAAITVICPAAPEHGRTVYQGHLFVGTRLLSDSPMRHHPLTPMTESDVARLLAPQTPHPVGLVPHAVIRQGPAAVRGELGALRRQGIRHVVVDALDDDDLDMIALAADDLPVLTGAAGLARAIGDLISADGGVGRTGETPPFPEGPGLVLSGSCSAATLRQVARAAAALPSHRIDPVTTPDPHMLRKNALEWLDAHVRAGKGSALVYSSAPPGERDGRALGDGTGEALERILADVARHAAALGFRRIVVAGGETSGAVLNVLGVRSVVVAAEVDRGVPWCLTTTEPAMALLLKSGNFGADDLLVRAIKAAP